MPLSLTEKTHSEKLRRNLDQGRMRFAEFDTIADQVLEDLNQLFAVARNDR